MLLGAGNKKQIKYRFSVETCHECQGSIEEGAPTQTGVCVCMKDGFLEEKM